MRAKIASFVLALVPVVGLVLACCVCSVSSACSAGTNDIPSGPSTVVYEIGFPSTAAAVAADTVQAFVFANPSAANRTDCANLIVARQSGAGLPPAQAQTGQVAICTVLAGPSQAELPNVPYGEISFLVVTQRNGIDYFTGCALATLADAPDASPLTIDVELEQAVATTPIPSTNCGSVSAFCASPPTCCVGCDSG